MTLYECLPRKLTLLERVIQILRLLTRNTKVQEIIAQLRQTWDLLINLMDMLEAFTRLMYAPKSSTTKFNRLKYNLICAKNRKAVRRASTTFVKNAQRVVVCKICLHQDP